MKLYGLKNCDSCKKALSQLRAAGRDIEFFDIRTDPLDQSQIIDLLARHGDPVWCGGVVRCVCGWCAPARCGGRLGHGASAARWRRRVPAPLPLAASTKRTHVVDARQPPPPTTSSATAATARATSRHRRLRGGARPPFRDVQLRQ